MAEQVTTDELHAWIKTLRVGDVVAVRRDNAWSRTSSWEKSHVIRVTPTGRLRIHGHEKFFSPNTFRLAPWTPELAAKETRRRLVAQVWRLLDPHFMAEAKVEAASIEQLLNLSSALLPFRKD